MVAADGRGAKRRGARTNPANRFEPIHLGPSADADADAPAPVGSLPILPTEVFRDQSRSVVTENKSPDLWFRWSLNPYRGCEHGCVYCYARPTHEMLGFSAGLDFETKIMAKTDAPRLLKDFLRSSSYTCEPLVLSGVTDPYQPVERELRITRQCLEVMLECGQPVEIVTKSRLILRDLDLLKSLAARRLVRVSVAVTTLDENLQHEMEPRASSPLGRLDIIRQLSQARVPTQLLIAPVIPGLTDSEIPSILKSAKLCGARSARYVLLRLPLSVRDIFVDWLERTYPRRAPAVLSRIRATREGKLNDSRFGTRMTGVGTWSEQLDRLFHVFSRVHGINEAMADLDCSQFQAPADPSGQLLLFS